MFAILFEVILIEIQEEIHHFAGWEGGGVKGRKNCEQTFCEQTGVSYLNNLHKSLGNNCRSNLEPIGLDLGCCEAQYDCTNAVSTGSIT